MKISKEHPEKIQSVGSCKQGILIVYTWLEITHEFICWKDLAKGREQSVETLKKSHAFKVEKTKDLDFSHFSPHQHL